MFRRLAGSYAEQFVPHPDRSSGRNCRGLGRSGSLPPNVSGRAGHDRVRRAPPPSFPRICGRTPPGPRGADAFGWHKGGLADPSTATRRPSIETGGLNSRGARESAWLVSPPRKFGQNRFESESEQSQPSRLYAGRECRFPRPTLVSGFEDAPNVLFHGTARSPPARKSSTVTSKKNPGFGRLHGPNRSSWLSVVRRRSARVVR
jgi:hypothetical protein